MKKGLSVVLATLMAVSTMIGLVGCGAEGSSGPNVGGMGNTSAIYENTGSSSATISEWTEEEASMEDVSSVEEDDEFFEMEEDEEGIGHGIVTCINRKNYPYEDYIVFLVDP